MTQRLTFRYIIKVYLGISLVMLSVPVYAKQWYVPTGMQWGIDLLRPFQYQHYGRQGNQWEWHVTTDFKKIILITDLGWGHIRWQGNNQQMNIQSRYENQGIYTRIGINYNFLCVTPDKNQAFLGLQYGHSIFVDILESALLQSQDALQPMEAIPIRYINNNMVANWWEIVAGGTVKLWRRCYVGGLIRYQYWLHCSQTSKHIPYDVPGWGLTSSTEVLGLSYYLVWRIL